MARKKTVNATVAFNMDNQTHVKVYELFKALKLWFIEQFPDNPKMSEDSEFLRALIWNCATLNGADDLFDPSRLDVVNGLENLSNYMRHLAQQSQAQYESLRSLIGGRQLGLSDPLTFKASSEDVPEEFISFDD